MNKAEYKQKIQEIIQDIDEEVFKYNEDEYWMYKPLYEYIELYALEHQLTNTLIALQLTRGLHNNVYRKFSMFKRGTPYKVPYLIHPLSVCKELVDLKIDLTKEEEDILYAAALCHDVIEDIPFEHKGKELYTQFHLDYAVYETVLYVSKEKGYTKEQTAAYYDNIQKHELALFIKLADRGNNVEDLYNMTFERVHSYIDETTTYILPMCDYANLNYPIHQMPYSVLVDKIHSLISLEHILIDRYHYDQEDLRKSLDELREENRLLQHQWNEIMKG